MAGKHGNAKRRMQNMVSADALVLLLSQKVILVSLSSRGMIYETGDQWSKPSMKCEMVEEMAVVNRLIGLHVVLSTSCQKLLQLHRPLLQLK
jgi:hypothetical protein